jgi:hypothetical protein
MTLTERPTSNVEMLGIVGFMIIIKAHQKQFKIDLNLRYAKVGHATDYTIDVPQDQLSKL